MKDYQIIVLFISIVWLLLNSIENEKVGSWAAFWSIVQAFICVVVVIKVAYFGG